MAQKALFLDWQVEKKLQRNLKQKIKLYFLYILYFYVYGKFWFIPFGFVM